MALQLMAAFDLGSTCPVCSGCCGEGGHRFIGCSAQLWCFLAKTNFVWVRRSWHLTARWWLPWVCRNRPVGPSQCCPSCSLERDSRMRMSASAAAGCVHCSVCDWSRFQDLLQKSNGSSCLSPKTIAFLFWPCRFCRWGFGRSSDSEPVFLGQHFWKSANVFCSWCRPSLIRSCQPAASAPSGLPGCSLDSECLSQPPSSAPACGTGTGCAGQNTRACSFAFGVSWRNRATLAADKTAATPDASSRNSSTSS